MRNGWRFALLFAVAIMMAPAHSRYLQVDPAGMHGGAHAYVYASNDPVRRIDPDGLKDFISCVFGGPECAPLPLIPAQAARLGLGYDHGPMHVTRGEANTAMAQGACVLVCGSRNFLGATLTEASVTAAVSGAMQGLATSVKECVDGAGVLAKRGIPVINLASTISDVAGTVVCTRRCF